MHGTYLQMSHAFDRLLIQHQGDMTAAQSYVLGLAGMHLATSLAGRAAGQWVLLQKMRTLGQSLVMPPD